MKSIFWGNYKGGVGKTTSTFQVAAHFAKQGKNVLLVDLDPQCSLSNICCSGLNIKLESIEVNKTFNYLIELYMREISNKKNFDIQLLSNNIDSIAGKFVANTIHKLTKDEFKNNLSFIPSSLIFSNCRMNEMSQFMSENIYNIFLIKQFIDDINKIECNDIVKKFDYIFFDCPPTTNILTQSVFLASDYYVIPTICDEVSTNGVPDYIVEIEKTHNKYSMNDKIRGILMQKVFPTKPKFIGVFETLYKNRGGSPKNYYIIETLDKNINQISGIESLLSNDKYLKFRYDKTNNNDINPENIETKNIFNEAIDHKDARKSGSSIPKDTANALINDEYEGLSLAILDITT